MINSLHAADSFTEGGNDSKHTERDLSSVSNVKDLLQGNNNSCKVIDTAFKSGNCIVHSSNHYHNKHPNRHVPR